MASIHFGLKLCRPAGADEPNRLLITFRVHDKNQTPLDRSDGDEPVLLVGMDVIEDFQVVVSTMEQALASSKEMPCLFRFVRFLDSSQMTLTA
jgi:hypothetical protein